MGLEKYTARLPKTKGVCFQDTGLAIRMSRSPSWAGPWEDPWGEHMRRGEGSEHPCGLVTLR